MVMLLFVLTGCSKIPEIKYDGKDVVYTCTKDEIELLKSDVDVIAEANQGFLTIVNGEWNEVINNEEKHEIKYREKNSDNGNVDACYFINYDNMNYKFGTTTPISFKDKDEGGIRFHVKGNYDYTIDNMQLFYDNILSTEDFGDTMETVYRKINAEIVATYILNMNSKTFAELKSETVFNEKMIERVNSIIKDAYGIKLTKVNIENVEKIS